MPIDRKEAWRVKKLHTKIEEGNYSEEDVFAFLMHLRERSPKGSALREFADFIAHREKDRGRIFEYVLQTQDILNQLGRITATLVIEPVFTVDQFERSTEAALSQLGLRTPSKSRINDLFICIISLLQDVRLVARDSSPIGELQVAISESEVVLIGATTLTNGVSVSFPALVAASSLGASTRLKEPAEVTGITWCESRGGDLDIFVAEGT